jgi:transposase
MAVVLAPLIDLFREEAIVGSDVRHGDNTTPPILALGSGKTKTGALLGLCAGRASSQCDASAGVCVFRLAGPQGQAPSLMALSGVSQADAQAGFDRLCGKTRAGGGLIETNLRYALSSRDIERCS